MRSSLIPWHVFLYAVKEQPPSAMETWLRRWLFTNDGVIIAHPKDESARSLAARNPRTKEGIQKPRLGA